VNDLRLFFDNDLRFPRNFASRNEFLGEQDEIQ
jgi:hypothetical protein